MARGGGTGARNKSKKKSDTVISNGATAATTNGNGILETDKKFTDTKVNKQRKLMDTVANPQTDEEIPSKEEKVNKLQPTSEQLRLAQITQDSTLDPQRKGKISQVIDFTGKSEDEVATALFDCSWDVQRAIEFLLEEGGDLGSWEESGKKKKKKQDKEKEEKEGDWDDYFEPVNSRQDSDNFRDRSRGGRGGAPRFKRGGGPGYGRQDRDGFDPDRMEGGRGRGGGRGGGMSRGARGGLPYRARGRGGSSMRGGMGSTGSYMGGSGGGREGVGLGPDSGPFGQMDTWNPAGEEINGKSKSSNKDAFDNAGNWGDDFPAAEDWDNDEYTGSLSDTKVFTPSGAPSSRSAVGQPINPGAGGQAPSSVNSAGQLQPSAGQLQPANTPSANPQPYGQQIDLAALLHKPGITPVGGGSSAAPGGPTSINQFNQTATQDLKSAIGIGGPSPAVNSNSSVSAVSAVNQSSSVYSSSIDYSSGAPGSAPGGVVGSGASQVYSQTGGGVGSGSSQVYSQQAQNNFGSNTPGSAFSPIKPAGVTNVNPNGGAKATMPRARLPPPSKIPASAVEMPGESLANLDVQFGGLDLQFGASNEASSGGSAGNGPPQAAGFDFRASALSVSSKDLDSSSKYIGITSTDKYKTKSMAQAAVNMPTGGNKEEQVVGNPNLSSAMSGGPSVGGIKSSSSADSSFGSVAAAAASVVQQQQQRGDSVTTKPNSNFSSQRSPGPVQSMGLSKAAVAVTDSLGGFSANPAAIPSPYSGYQVSQSKPSSNQFGSHSSVSNNSSGYPSSANGYDRQSSGGGYSSTGYGSGSVANSFGGSSSVNSQNNGGGVASSNPSYSSNTGVSSGVNSSNTSNNAFNSGYSANSYSSYSTKPSTTATGKLENSSVGGSSSYSNNFGISSANNKMNVNSSVSSKMLHNLPPGVANMIPQYMMTGAGAATFPHYLAAGLQQPMYGYGAAGAAAGAAGAAGGVGAQAPQLGRGGVSSQQLEDLAAMQRNTLANLPGANLPLVGAGQAQSQASSKGPHTGGYYDPSGSGGFGSGAGQAASSAASTRSDAASSMTADNTNKFGGAGSAGTGLGSVNADSTSSPVPTSVATGQPTPFNALASTFAAAPTQHLPPGYAYFYGGMTPQLQAAYGGTSVYPPHPGIVPTAAGPTATTQFQNKGYGSSYNSYDNLNLGQNNSDYKSNFQSQAAQQSKGTNSNTGHWYNGGLW